MKPCWKNKNDKREYIMIFSAVVLTEKEEF